MAASARAPLREAHEEPIIAIGENGSVRPVGKLDAHYRGLRHAAVSIFVFAGDILLLGE